MYGGSKNKRWFSDVNILDLQRNMWSAVKVCKGKLTLPNILLPYHKSYRQPTLQELIINPFPVQEKCLFFFLK